MPPNSNRWKAVSESEYAWEREALEFIRERLPDREPYRAWANFEFVADDGSVNEVDLLALTPQGFFLVEIKSRPGVLRGDAGTWTWETDGRKRTLDNPLLGANKKAKKLVSLLRGQKSARKIQSRFPFLEALVFCSDPDLKNQLFEVGKTRVCLRDREAEGDRPRRPGIVAAMEERIGYGLKPTIRTPIDRPIAKAITRAMEEAGIRESRRKRQVGDYRLRELIDEGPNFQDWRAEHVSMSAAQRRIRVYPVRLAAESEDRLRIERAAQREFQLVERLRHPCVLRTYDLANHAMGPAIVFEHFPRAMRLDLFLAERAETLGPDQRLHLLRSICETVQYAHQNQAVHRALSPRSILVTEPEQPESDIKIFNWQAGFRSADDTGDSFHVSATEHVSQLVEDSATAYMAPEAQMAVEEGGFHLDVFSLGAIAYHLFTNRPPAAHALELTEKLRSGDGLQVSSVVNGAGEHLQFLIQFATHPDVTARMDSAEDFLECLDAVEEELTTPDDQKETVSDPTRAKTNDQFPGGFLVRKRLGQGASSVGYLVERQGQEAILKIAVDVDHNGTLRAEAETLKKMRHPRIVEFLEELEIGDRRGILLRALTRSLKGKNRVVQTLRRWLATEGRLQLDLLQRFGEDLLDALAHMEEVGVYHRDIKPDNLAVANVGSRDELHLVLFDFSLSNAPLDNIRVGTKPYLDPFLPRRSVPSWDPYAERWAAAVTLHEMAAGVRPVWHDGKTDPLLVEHEATIDAEQFESGAREELARFFRKALRRDPTERFHNAGDMLREWRELFKRLEHTAVPTSDHGDASPETAERFPALTLQSPLSEVGLSTRAANSLDRLNVLTVNDLLRAPIIKLHRIRGVGQKTRREITDAVAALRERLGPPEGDPLSLETVTPPESEETDPGTAAPSVDRMAEALLRSRERRGGESARSIIRALLGLSEGPAGPWPTQADAGRALNLSRARVGQVLTDYLGRWKRNAAVTGLRKEMEEILKVNGGAMSLREMADALLAARGSVQVEPLRSRLAMALVRAAAEVERTLAEPRFWVRRAGDRVLLALGPELADYAVRLGDLADRLAQEDPLLPTARAAERLQELAPPPEADPVPPARLTRLAAAASAGAALSLHQQELYPRGMSAERALKLCNSALLGVKRLTVADIRRRVAGRYPEAEPLPGPPGLDRMLQEAGLALTWRPEAEKGRGAYVYPSLEPDLSGSGSSLYRYSTATGGLVPGAVSPDVAAARRFEERLAHNRADGGFIALSVSHRWYAPAIDLLAERFDLRVFDLEKAFMAALETEARDKRVQWGKIVEADAAPPESLDWQRLVQLARIARPRVERELAGSRDFLLMIYPGVLARYGWMDWLTDLRERAGRRAEDGGIPGLWILIPGDEQSSLPKMEGKAVPVISSGQHARVPESWLENRHRANAETSARRKVNG
jgi:serine/threonine protein kinase